MAPKPHSEGVGGHSPRRPDPTADHAGPLYELEWLQTCYTKVSFPNPKCADFLAEVNEKLSERIRGELDNEVKQQALFQLLGEDYVRMHFPHHKWVSYPPNFCSAIQSYCPCISADLLSYDSISTLIRLNGWNCSRIIIELLSYDSKPAQIRGQYDWMAEIVVIL